MDHSPQSFFTAACTEIPPTFEMRQEEQEAAVLEVPQTSVPMTTTMINIAVTPPCPMTLSGPCSTHAIFMNPHCLGFVTFACSLKFRYCKMVGLVIGAQSHCLLPVPEHLGPDVEPPSYHYNVIIFAAAH